MSVDATKNLKLRIGTEPLPGMTKPLDDLLKATNAVTEAEKKYQQLVAQRNRALTGDDFRGLGRAALGATHYALGIPYRTAAGAAGTAYGVARNYLVGSGPHVGGLAGQIAQNPMAHLEQAAQRMTGAFEALSNSTLNVAQKQEQVVASLVPMAQTFINLRDAIHGVNNSIRLSQFKAERAHIGIGIEAERDMLALTHGRRRGGGMGGLRRGGFAGVGHIAPTPFGQHDRMSYTGEIAFQEEVRLNPLLDAEKRAKERARAQGEAYKHTEAEYAKRETQLDALEANRKKAEARTEEELRRVNTRAADPERNVRGMNAVDRWVMEHAGTIGNVLTFGTNGESTANLIRGGINAGDDWAQGGAGTARAGIGNSSREAMTAAEASLSKINTLRQAGLRMQMEETALVQAESQARKATIAVEKERLSILEQQTKRMQHGAQALGSMSPAQRAMALRGAEMLAQTKNPNMVPRHLLQLAERVSPGFVGRFREQAGEQSKEFGAFQKLGAIDKGTIKEHLEQSVKARLDLQVKVSVDEEELANRMHSIMEKFFKRVEVLIDKKDAAQHGRQTQGEHLRNANQQ